MSGDHAAGEPRLLHAVTPLQVEAAYEVRIAVFVDEQGVPPELETDAADDTADHLLALQDGKAVGTGRLVVEPAGYDGLDAGLGEVAHLGRLAVLPPARGAGLGVALVEAIEQRARERSLRVIVLASQSHAVEFYRRLGYRPYGPEFDDAGIPHRMMRKDL